MKFNYIDFGGKCWLGLGGLIFQYFVLPLVKIDFRLAEVVILSILKFGVYYLFVGQVDLDGGLGRVLMWRITQYKSLVKVGSPRWPKGWFGSLCDMPLFFMLWFLRRATDGHWWVKRWPNLIKSVFLCVLSLPSDQ